MAVPVFHVEAAFGSYPGDTSYSWTDISSRGRSMTYSRGRQFQLDRTQAGTGSLVVSDADRAFDSTYASSPYYPDVIPMCPVRGYAVIAATTYYQFSHYVTNWKRRRQGPNYADRDVPTVDGFEVLQKPLQPSRAAVTTAIGGNRDITYTSVEPGQPGNKITIRYNLGKPDLHVSLSHDDLSINIPPGGVTANALIAFLNTKPQAYRQVTPTLAPGSDGTGTITTAQTYQLSGGAPFRIALGLSGTHVTAALNSIGWPSALRVIGTGKSTIRAITLQPGDSVACLEYLQQVCGAGGEEGLVFIDGRGRLVFLDRWAAVSSPYTVSQVTFTDSGSPGAGEVSYQDSSPDYGKDLIVNEWTGTRTGGTPQTALDLVSQGKYLRRVREISSVLGDNDQLIGILQLRLARFKDPLDRLEWIKVMPHASTTAWQACLAREPGDRVTVKQNPPGGGSTDSREYIVQAIKADIDYADPVKSEFTFQLWPADVGNWLILDDAAYGLLDYNRLAA